MRVCSCMGLTTGIIKNEAKYTVDTPARTYTRKVRPVLLYTLSAHTYRKQNIAVVGMGAAQLCAWWHESERDAFSWESE